MIAFFNKNETDFTHNGLGVLDENIINPVVTEELNGIFSLEFDYPTHAPHAKELLQERIVRCPVPEMDDQLFRISERDDNLGGVFHIVAYHVFYDLAQNFIENTFVVNRNGTQAIQQILNAAQFTHPFTGSSDIGTYASSRLVRRNMVVALLKDDLSNSFLSRWGGEILRDNFHVAFRRVRGSDNGVYIRDKKNLTGYRSNVDFGTVVTRIMPQGFDGLLLPEKYIDSPLIGNYLTPRIRVIKYDKVKAAVGQYAEDEDAVPLPEALAMLRTLAAKEYSEHKIDLPNATYDVQFAPLEQTEEYKEFAALESIAIGDTVKVVHEEDGFDISARMVGYKYNPFTRSYIGITLGNYAPKFTDVAKTISRIETGIEQARDDANFALQSANGKNTNYYGSATPANPRKGDVWFKENGDKLELWIYETRDGVTQWFPLVNDLTQEQMRLELEEAKALVEEAKIKSEAAIAAGADAAIAAAQAKIAGEEAKAAAEDAQAAGDAALIAGQNALSVGQAAQTAAEQAKVESGEAVDKANQAFDNATSALTNSNNAITQAGAANTTAAQANTVAGNAFNKSVKSTAVSYAVSTSGVTAPTIWQATVPTTTAGQFLWTRTVITLQDDNTITSFSVAKHGETGAIGATGATGATGTAGKGVASSVIAYQAGTSGTTAPTGTWATTIPSVSASQFLWSRTVITYTDNTTSTSFCVDMMGATGANGQTGATGATGTAGRGVSSTAITYQASTSGTVTPTGTWAATIPSVSASQFLWTRTIITYTDSTISTSFCVGMMGATGAVGATGATGTAGRGISSTAITYQASSSGTTTPTGTWATTIPSVTASQYLWSRTIITYTDSTTSTSYSVGMMGATGATGAVGATGATGAAGRGISSTAITYQSSASGTAIPTGTWSTTIPSVSASQFLWTRTIITYTDNTTSTSYSVGMMGATGATGAAGEQGIPGMPISIQELLPGQTGTAQRIVVQYSGTYKIIARGAAGMESDSRNRPANAGFVGGKGAEISAEFDLIAGDVLTVIVGKMGTRTDAATIPTDGSGGPGGGGTFVFRNIASITDARYQFTKDGQNFEVLLVAAGGGGTTDLNYSTTPQNGMNGVGASWYSLSNYISPNATTFNGTASTSQATGGSIQQYLTNNAIGGYYTRQSNISRGGYGGGAVADDARSSGGGWFCNTTTAHSWSIGAKTAGLTGINDSNGSILIAPVGLKGDPAPTITGVREQYYLSTSNTNQSGGSWSDTVPVWVNGRFYWTRVASTYSDGSILYSTPVLDNGLNHSLVTALEVKTVNETLQTTISQHATTISLNASNITSLSGRVTTAEAAINLLPTTIRLNVESLIAPAPLIRGWEINRWNNSNGTHINDTNSIRGTHDIPVNPGKQFVGQTADGTALAFEYYWYNSSGTFISATMNTTNVATAPANAATLRIANRNHSSPPDEFTGIVVRGNTRINMTVRPVSASTILMQNNFINLRVAKGEIINQINISPESILIAGNKIRITGQTTIDNAVITNAMIANLAVNTAKIADASISTAKIADLAVSTAKIANAAITNAKIGNLAVGTAQIADAAITTVKIGDAQINNAKIANLDAGKINTGTLSADRIAAGSITSAKLTIANGFITNAMIADATILNAKIGTVDAAKITTGILNAARIGANSITADKISANFLQTLTGSASIRITGTTISYYSGSNLTAQLNSSGLELTRDNIKIGRIGTNNMSANSTWRGLVFDLENAGNYMCWAWRETANASSYTTKLTYYRSRLQNGMEKGFHFDDAVFIKGGQSAASGSTVVTNNWGFWTFGSTSYLGRVTTNSKAGVALGGSSLILGSQGNWVDFNTIRAICALLSGRRIYLPASSGGLSSWWDTSFPSMTTWST